MVDAAAIHTMRCEHGPWVQWCLTPQSKVGMVCQGVPAVALLPVQQPLEAFLGQLEASGHVPLKVYGHTCQRISGQTGRYTIVSESPAVVVVRPDLRSSGLNVDNVARFINIHGLKTAAHSEVNWQLIYCPQEQKLIRPEWPHVHLKANVKLAPQESLCISAPFSVPVAMVRLENFSRSPPDRL